MAKELYWFDLTVWEFFAKYVKNEQRFAADEYICSVLFAVVGYY